MSATARPMKIVSRCMGPPVLLHFVGAAPPYPADVAEADEHGRQPLHAGDLFHDGLGSAVRKRSEGRRPCPSWDRQGMDMGADDINTPESGKKALLVGLQPLPRAVTAVGTEVQDPDERPAVRNQFFLKMAEDEPTGLGLVGRESAHQGPGRRGKAEFGFPDLEAPKIGWGGGFCLRGRGTLGLA